MLDETDQALPLSERLARSIRDLVIAGDLAPGQRLSEAAFSERFEVSRNSLREAFRLLTKERLLKHESNRGVFVASPSTADLLDIYQVRRLIECGSIRRGWQKHPALKIMRKAVESARLHVAKADWRAVGSANMEFHAAVVELSDSPRLSEFYKRVSAELRLGFGLLSDPEQLHAPFIAMNAEILRLTEAGQVDDACEAMSVYLTVSERTVLAAFAKI